MSMIFSNEVIQNLLIVVITILFAPVIGGLLTGVDRKISARMQGRYGPPVLQPFYDFFKLWGKQKIVVNQTQDIYVIGNLIFAIFALILLVLKQDLLMLVFVLAFANVSLIVGAMSVKSPYSKIGAQREIIQLMACEPVLLLMVVGVYFCTKSFMISSIFNLQEPLLFKLPLIFLAFLYILTIKLRKSPFDFSTSHHAHQELIKGMMTEFSGPQLALIELAHWYELVLLMGLISLFFANPIYIGILIALAAYFLEIIIDNVTARLNWKLMLKYTLVYCMCFALINIVYIYIMKG